MTDFEVVVCGAGMAGLAAAAAATARGARVLVVEKLDAVGGSAAISSGYLWTAPDYATFIQRVPRANRVLARTLVDDFDDAVAWVRGTGVEISPRVGNLLGFGVGYVIDVHGLFARWRAMIESRGGWIALGTAASGLISRGVGIRGITVNGPDGSAAVEARAVVLATGGFQGNPALRSQFIGQGADEMLVRSSRGSVGDGFLMAEKVGAGVSTGLSAFYGHLVPSPLDSFAEGDFLPLTQYHSNQCILVNTAGRRFMDESLGDDYANQDVFRQPERRAVLIADERIRREYVVTAPFEQGEAVDRFERAADAGARFIGERTLDRLATRVAAWGVNGSALLRTLRDDRRLADPPFYALEVQPTITFPHGGLLIDGDGRVVDRDGRWIPGLYAAGADVGGVFNRGYAGGLAAALVFGRRAGRAAADWAADRQSGRILEMRRPLIQTAPRERYVS